MAMEGRTDMNSPQWFADTRWDAGRMRCTVCSALLMTSGRCPNGPKHNARHKRIVAQRAAQGSRVEQESIDDVRLPPLADVLPGHPFFE